MIWVPSNAVPLQKAMHESGHGPAALVAVPSGTVLLPSPDIRLSEAVAMAARARKMTSRSALFIWNDEAALYFPFVDRGISRGWLFGRQDVGMRLWAQAKQAGAIANAADKAISSLTDGRKKDTWQRAAAERAGRLHVGADLDAALEVFRDYENAVDVVPRLLTAAGLPDVAQVAGLVAAGGADSSVRPLAPPRVPRWSLALLAVAGLLWILSPLVVPIESLAVYFGGLVFLAACFLLSTTVMQWWLVRRRPVDAVLPVIPVTWGAAPTD